MSKLTVEILKDLARQGKVPYVITEMSYSDECFLEYNEDYNINLHCNSKICLRNNNNKDVVHFWAVVKFQNMFEEVYQGFHLEVVEDDDYCVFVIRKNDIESLKISKDYKLATEKMAEVREVRKLIEETKDIQKESAVRINTYLDNTQSFKTEYDGESMIKTPLIGNGDFSSDECVEILKECDVVVTNPPFSLWRQFIHLLILYNKKFLAIGNKTAVIYRELFYKVKENKVWFGYTIPKEFITPDGITKKVSGIYRWFTNIEPRPTIEDMKLIEFDQSKHRRYSNYMAVNVDNIKQIPDTNEIIGVPITFLDKYNPEQFEILGMSGDREFVDSDCDFFIPVTKEQKNIFKEQNKDWRDTHPYFSDGDKLTKLLYVRLFIRKKGT